MNKKTTYKDAGVDIAKAESALGSLKERIAAYRDMHTDLRTGVYQALVD